MKQQNKAKQFCQVCCYSETCQQICPRLEAHLQRRIEDPRKRRIELVYLNEMPTKQANRLEQFLYGNTNLNYGDEER